MRGVAELSRLHASTGVQGVAGTLEEGAQEVGGLPGADATHPVGPKKGVTRFERAVPHAEKQSTPYARDMIELLLLKSDNDLVCAIEAAIETKVHDSGLPIDHAANQIYIAAALTKIRKQPDDWADMVQGQRLCKRSLTWRGSTGRHDGSKRAITGTTCSYQPS